MQPVVESRFLRGALLASLVWLLVACNMPTPSNGTPGAGTAGPSATPARPTRPPTDVPFQTPPQFATAAPGVELADGQYPPASPLPPGDAARGQALFLGEKPLGVGGYTASCQACHSLKPGEILLGPSLAAIGATAAKRVTSPDYHGKARDAAGYIHESIVQPNAYLAPGSAGYASNGISRHPQNLANLMTPQDLADLVAYLAALQGPGDSPTRAPSATVPGSSPCAVGLPSRLTKGGQALVIPEPPKANNVRSDPDKGAQLLGQLKPGEKMDVLDGPVCSSIGVWWKVHSQAQPDLTGWTLEGDTENYWLAPVEP